jgi:hypothetical protein
VCQRFGDSTDNIWLKNGVTFACMMCRESTELEPLDQAPESGPIVEVECP